MTIDDAVAIALVGAAALYLGRRLWRLLRARGGCACSSAGSCPAASAIGRTLDHKPWEEDA